MSDDRQGEHSSIPELTSLDAVRLLCNAIQKGAAF
jgi:hypothetical protein